MAVSYRKGLSGDRDPSYGAVLDITRKRPIHVIIHAVHCLVPHSDRKGSDPQRDDALRGVARQTHVRRT